jgi:hypothetical protein
MRPCLIVSLLLAAGASAALAHTVPQALPHGASAVLQAQMGAPAAPKKGRPVAKAAEPESDKATGDKATTDSLRSCLAMWERATHMSRQEWARACRRVDERLRTITVK